MSWVWKVDGPPKIQFFLWLCLHNSIPTCEVLGSRGLNLSPTFPICTKGNESIEHMLRGCKSTVELWQKLEFPYCLVDSFKKPVAEWLQVNYKILVHKAFGRYGICSQGICSKFLGIPWRIIFIISIWQIWIHRNEFAFRTGRPN